MIDEVESFGAELKAEAVGDRKRLEQTKVPVLESGLVNNVSNSRCVECSGGRWPEYPLVFKVESGWRAACQLTWFDQVNFFDRTQACAGSVVPCSLNYSYIFPDGKLVPNRIPTVNMSPLSGLSGGPYPSHSAGPIYNISDSFTWIKGNHTLKFGRDHVIAGFIRGCQPFYATLIPHSDLGIGNRSAGRVVYEARDPAEIGLRKSCLESSFQQDSKEAHHENLRDKARRPDWHGHTPVFDLETCRFYFWANTEDPGLACDGVGQPVWAETE